MRTHYASFIALALLLPLAACTTEPRTLEEVSADIAEKSKKIKTYAADFDTAMSMGSMLMNFNGTMQGKEKMMAMTTNMDMMQQKISIKMVVDASNTMWMDMDMMGMKQVMKMDMTQMAALQEEMMGMMPGGMGGLGGLGGMQGDPREMLEQAQKSMDLTYTGKEKLGEENVYVFSAVMKPEALAQMNEAMESSGASAMGMNMADMMSGARMKFGVADGFPRTMEMLDKDGTVWMTQTYKNLKLNESMDDALFTYTPAEGVMVMDMTEMMDAGAEPGAPEEPTEIEQP